MPETSFLLDAGYHEWSQVAGYFDGDGSVVFVPGLFTVLLGALWTDTYKPQIEHIANFLRHQGLSPSKVYVNKRVHRVTTFAWNVRLPKRGGVLKAFKEMLPYLDKKREQTKAAIDYLENRTTGSELIGAFKEAVKLGARSGEIREVGMPWTRDEGMRIGRKIAGERAWKIRKGLTATTLEKTAANYKDSRLSMRELGKVYGFSASTVSRFLRERKGR